MLRHERQTVAMELAAAFHHSRDGGREANYGLRAPKTASSGRRPGVLTEPEPPNVVDRVLRRTVDQIVDSVPGLPALDVPVPLMVEQLVDILQPWTFPRRSQVAPEPQRLLHLGVGEVHARPTGFLSPPARVAGAKGGGGEEEAGGAGGTQLSEGSAAGASHGLSRSRGSLTSSSTGGEEEEEEADASDLLSLSSWPRSTSTAAVACSFCWF